MNTSTHAQQLADLFATNGLEAVVVLELAERADAEIAIWPYAVDDDPARRNEHLPARSPTGESFDQDHFQRTHVLVVPSTLAAYDRARELVIAHPVLPLSDPPAKVLIEVLAPVDMAALFSASRVVHRIALALEIC